MLNIISPINQLGYGIAGLNICKELDNMIKVSLFPIGQPQVTNSKDHSRITDMMANSRMPNFDGDCIRIWHQHDMSQWVGRGKRIGFPIFELDKFNDVELYHLSSLDKIFVCSEWAKQVILDNIQINKSDVHVIPLGVDSRIFDNSLDNQQNDATIFFNCGKWEKRKGHDFIVKSFNDAFNQSDNVELWMMCENPFNTEEEEKAWRDLYLGSKLGNKIKIINRVDTQQEVYNIMAKVTCGVFPARAEGWNLELLEMMACNKPVITTNYSAHTEFCTEENSLLIPIEDVEKASDDKFFSNATGNWAKITDKEISILSSLMKKVHEEEITNNPAGVETAKQFSWKNSAKKILEILDV